ncbi:response regulator transcription factor [Nocardia yamanashiensis]|uniref:response regulator transcription factor n=1 Tax=Nocardia yamanashiensis TaxID=209247 RepID=UPI001E5D03D6|nr:response regulator transcription factor [Nocardia yamanashiensis]UGT43523.1 response regulator transcription factor [Nocardia yamanashiensis]
MNATGVKVVVAEDSLLIRDAVLRVLATDASIEVAGIATDFDATLELVRAHRPDVLITDIRMPPTGTDEGVRLARLLRDSHPETAVIVLSHYAEPEYATALLDGGSAGRGYLLKERIARFEQLLNAVHVVAGGGSVLDPTIMEVLLSRQRDDDMVRLLTTREREVLAEIACGGSNRVVAQRLSLTQRAVEKHINSIFAKFGLTADPALDHRVSAVLLFLASKND